ncbi:MAG TPA: hypothetical protein VNB91_13015, partial [Jatrophihabitantaceae bacterium]|nr:hypothetical protein [Jatrophihabitantaceae bacterium]
GRHHADDNATCLPRAAEGSYPALQEDDGDHVDDRPYAASMASMIVASSRARVPTPHDDGEDTQE